MRYREGFLELTPADCRLVEFLARSFDVDPSDGDAVGKLLMRFAAMAAGLKVREGAGRAELEALFAETYSEGLNP